MTNSQKDLPLTLRHILVPVTLLSVTILLLIGYQTGQIMKDRDALNVTKGQQEKAFEDSQRLQGQLNALLVGTQKLADNGNKNAKVITDKLKDMGIQVMTPEKAQQNAQTSKAPVPASEIDSTGPVKP